jgi:hypothetical protein
MIRGTKKNQTITVSSFEKSGLLFKGSYKNFMKWFNRNDFKSCTVHHGYTVTEEIILNISNQLKTRHIR